MPSLISKLRPKTYWDYGLLVLIIIYSVLLSVLSILRHYTFRTTAWDLGIYEQVLWSTVNGGELLWYSVELPMNPSGTFFGIHFSPILFVFLPIYWMFQTTETLLILQSVFVALGALPLYLIVHHDTNKMTAFAYACVYFLYPPIYGMNLFDFHVQAFLPFFLLFAFHYLKLQKWIPYFVFIIFALMTIEFVPLIVLFLGLYCLWTCRKDLVKTYKTRSLRVFLNKRFLVSILTIVLAIGWFILAKSVLSFYNPSPRPHPNWAVWGDPANDLPGFIFSIISNPIRVIEIMFTPFNDKMFYIVGLFTPVGFLSFLSLPSLLIGTPWFLASLLSNYPPYYKPFGYQYVGFVIPFVFISAFYGAKHFIRILDVFRDKMANLKKLKIPLSITFARVFLGMILLSSLVLYISSQDLIMPNIAYHDQVLENITQLVPSNFSVLTQNNIFPHLSRRLYGYVGNNPGGNFSNIDFDYILVDTTSGWYVGGFESIGLPLYKYVPTVFMSCEYGVITAVDGIWLFRKGFDESPIFPVEKGIFGKFYNGSDSSADVLFESVFLDTDWDWTWQQPFPITTTNFTWSVTFSSFLYIPVTGAYQFSVSVNGMYRLYINNNLTIYSNETGIQNSDEILLQKGMCKIKVEYTKKINPGILKVSWKPPSKESYEIISHDHLFWNFSSNEE